MNLKTSSLILVIVSSLLPILMLVYFRNVLQLFNGKPFFNVYSSVEDKGSHSLYATLEDKLCEGMFVNGSFDSASKTWSPKGCKMIYYPRWSLRSCMKNLATFERRNYFVFVGDSRIKLLAGEFLLMISEHVALSGHVNGHHFDTEISLATEVLWHERVDDKMIDAIRQYLLMEAQYQPKLMVLGEAVHTIIQDGYNPDVMVESYGENITKLRRYLEKLKRTNVIWMLNQHVQVDKISHQHRFITNQLIQRMNTAAIQALYGSNVQIWYSSRLFTLQYPHEYHDGIHRGMIHYRADSQMLYNLLCNKFGFHATDVCCQKVARPQTLFRKSNKKKLIL